MLEFGIFGLRLEKGLTYGVQWSNAHVDRVYYALAAQRSEEICVAFAEKGVAWQQVKGESSNCRLLGKVITYVILFVASDCEAEIGNRGIETTRAMNMMPPCLY
jgi:hypothetical protein